MPKSTIGYYVIRIGRKSGIYMNWEECKEQIHQYPASIGVFFDDDDPRNLSEQLPGVYQTNN
ncbi:11611_t:CDS:2 [Gigaspora margarita]|uniref:11611_t:CDS:1 n=1 Tax=Gigaspora margarita TaxID=4874 RepID=A0ABN7W8K5_GIGMA|nr:11611_t:CDS:2 [Gigaspora margarita]